MAKKKENPYKNTKDSEIIESYHTNRKMFIGMAVMTAIGAAFSLGSIPITAVSSDLMKLFLSIGVVTSLVSTALMFHAQNKQEKALQEIKSRDIGYLLDADGSKEKQRQIERVQYVQDTSNCAYEIDISLKTDEKSNTIESGFEHK